MNDPASTSASPAPSPGSEPVSATPETSDRVQFAKLEKLRVWLRSDLHISRQIQEGEAVYVVHDPVGFKTHRMSQQDYEVTTRLSEDQPLGVTFEKLVESGALTRDDRDDFYAFVNQLHQLSLVSMPGQNGAKLFDAWMKKKRQERRNRFVRFLFIRVPLTDPDRFLTRTEPLMRFLFTRMFALVWLVAAGLTVGFLASQWRAFLQPLNHFLALKNLPLLWAALVTLKIWHELGHGFACKTFGGKVPEMGLLLLGGNPAAYVDATAAWSFERRRHRLVVMLGGMYFESLAAIVAVYVWALTTHPMLASWAHYVVTLSTVTTVLFNANPLMRFDGYFIFSELVGIQNLRPRSIARAKAVSKRLFLGLPDLARDNIPPRRRTLLTAYGFASSVYKATVMLGIAVAFSLRFPLVGLLLGVYFFCITVGGNLFRLGKYLLTSDEVQNVQWRARGAFALLFMAVPVLMFFVPVPFGIRAEGLQGAEVEHYLYAEAAGELQQVHVEPGQKVDAGTRLVSLSNPDAGISAHVAQAELEQARRGWEHLYGVNVVEAARLESRVESLELELDAARHTLNGLNVTSPISGTLARLMIAPEPGRFIRTGEPAAVIVRGPAVVRTWLTEEQIDRIAPTVGMPVEFRLTSRPMESFGGHVLAIRPVTSHLRDELALTQLGGGSLIVQKDTGKPVSPLFAVEIAPIRNLELMQYGTRVSVLFKRDFEPVALWAFRRCLKFVQQTLLS